jgi:hypothetical protein
VASRSTAASPARRRAAGDRTIPAPALVPHCMDRYLAHLTPTAPRAHVRTRPAVHLACV